MLIGTKHTAGHPSKYRKETSKSVVETTNISLKMSGNNSPVFAAKGSKCFVVSIHDHIDDYKRAESWSSIHCVCSDEKDAYCEAVILLADNNCGNNYLKSEMLELELVKNPEFAAQIKISEKMVRKNKM